MAIEGQDRRSRMTQLPEILFRSFFRVFRVFRGPIWPRLLTAERTQADVGDFCFILLIQCLPSCSVVNVFANQLTTEHTENTENTE